MSNITPDQSISGNKIAGGVISQFASTGIQDLATATSLIVSNDAITVRSANIPNLNGNVRVGGNLDVVGSVTFEENINFAKSLTIGGNLTANTLTVDRLIANVRQETTEPLSFTAPVMAGLNGMGLVWNSPDAPTQLSLLYKNGVLSSNMGLDIKPGQSFTVGGYPVISANAIGPSVVLSHLTQVGTLTSLDVAGNTKLENDVEINGVVSIYNNVNVNGNARFAGDITVNTITAQRIITPNGSGNSGSFTGNTESQLNGVGLSWAWADNNVQLIYRTGNRLWTGANIDLAETSSYNINGTPMLSATGLGPTVFNSNLKKVGTLNSLAVAGDATVGEFAFFNSTYNRFGIGLEEPNAAIGILENNVEIIIGSPAPGYARIGTHSNHDLELATDNLPRVTVKANGAVHIGDPVNGGGALNVYGTLYATTIQTDNRIDRTHPLQFNATAETSIYGLGLVWNDQTSTRQFIMLSGPDRIWSTESIDIGEDRSYYIGGAPALSATGLGASVVSSQLTSVGTLTGLTVRGDTVLETVAAADITSASLMASTGNQTLTVNGFGIASDVSLTVKAGTSRAFYADANQISIGDNSVQSKPVKVFGPLSVNVNNPDPSLQFSVAGDVNIGGKRFTNGASAPTVGVFAAGDICWNTMPQSGSYIGWVCVVSGTPGQWEPFGPIGHQ